MNKAFLSAKWVNLLMANYTVDKSILEPYVPAHTELDTWNNHHFVSVVGFLFKDTRVMGIQFPFHSDFEEVNLRFYVRYKVNNQWKRGVVFIKEIVPRKLISFIANTLYSENYETRDMTHRFTEDSKLNVDYRWRVGSKWNFLKAVAKREGNPPEPGSQEAFITEHYWGYSKINKTITSEYEVQHPSWDLHHVEFFENSISTKQLYGPAFEESLRHSPASVFLAAGSDIRVMGNRRIAGTATTAGSKKIQPTS